jgi:hypothetical protein
VGSPLKPLPYLLPVLVLPRHVDRDVRRFAPKTVTSGCWFYVCRASPVLVLITKTNADVPDDVVTGSG